jgi:hypothetical protein
VGGGGGMGEGGAIYVQSGGLTIENSTFDGNGAIGGDGSVDFSPDLQDRSFGIGGDGGVGGSGGCGILNTATDSSENGGGGGGARGDGGTAGPRSSN